MQKVTPSRKVQKRIFEDISGNNTVFFGEVLPKKNESITEFAVVVTDFNNKKVSISLISKSDIPRLIRELTKFI